MQDQADRALGLGGERLAQHRQLHLIDDAIPMVREHSARRAVGLGRDLLIDVARQVLAQRDPVVAPSAAPRWQQAPRPSSKA